MALFLAKQWTCGNLATHPLYDQKRRRPVEFIAVGIPSGIPTVLLAPCHEWHGAFFQGKDSPSSANPRSMAAPTACPVPVLAPADPGAVGAWAGRVLQPEPVQVMQMDRHLGFGQGVGCMAGQVMGKGEAQDRLNVWRAGTGGGLPPAAGEVWFSPSPRPGGGPPPPASRPTDPLGVTRQGRSPPPCARPGQSSARFQRADRGLPARLGGRRPPAGASPPGGHRPGGTGSSPPMWSLWPWLLSTRQGVGTCWAT